MLDRIRKMAHKCFWFVVIGITIIITNRGPFGGEYGNQGVFKWIPWGHRKPRR